MLKSTLNKVADIVFFIACIAFIVSLTLVYYFGYFSISFSDYTVYWVYIAPLAMVAYTLAKNFLLKPKAQQEDQAKQDKT